MKRLIKFFILILFIFMGIYCPDRTAVAAQIANVEYVHAVIKQKWNINIPYNPELKNPRLAANMKYLLTTIDVANEIINGMPITDYGNSSYATKYVADTVATIQAADTLIKDLNLSFSMTPLSGNGNTFSFSIGAAGTFYIAWGDGTIEKIEKNSTGLVSYSHTYAQDAGNYTVKLGGKATGYSQDYYDSAFKTKCNTSTGKISKIEGTLGKIFGTLENGLTPTFYQTFSNCKDLTGEIPEELFSGINGNVRGYMFYQTFFFCNKLTGSIPENLFAGISGPPAEAMFSSTFSGCSGLTGEIPEKLFANISGAPAQSMFASTFSGCKGLTGSIPGNLFAEISGTPKYNIFASTFYGCSGLTGSIPENLFAGISGAPANAMFRLTFASCTGLTGPIPENLFAGISGAPANAMFSLTFAGCSGLTGEIPGNLFAGISGAPATSMFASTFSGCSGLTGSIPEGIFGDLSGTPASSMFSGTFSGCSGLTGSIPEGIFGNLSGAPASSMFNGTFSQCRGLTGPSARMPDGTPLYEYWPDATTNEVARCYYQTNNLSDYSQIPSAWK